MKIGPIKIPIINCINGIYLRWYYNGFHSFLFQNGYEVSMSTESMGTQTTRFFSVISKVERPTRLKAEYSYKVIIEGITSANIAGFTGLLMAEKVMQLEDGVWREVNITRGEHTIREEWQNGYIVSFEVTRKELPNTSSVYQKSLKLYIDDTLCDMDDDEVVPINKQVNDIAEMQDRQSDFTAQFKIRKTRAMKGLFELSGETGINTNFPFEQKTCRLISDNIEIITGGIMILDRVDDQYYYVSILSGNLSFFKAIDKLKLTDLTLASTNHTWDVATMVNTHAADLDYVYPLCEPSEDGGIVMLPPGDTGDRVEMYGGWIWPFIKIKAIWDEIFTNSGFVPEGNILTNPIFLKLFTPINNLDLSNFHAYQYYYALYRSESKIYSNPLTVLPGGALIIGDATFAGGVYTVRYTGTYKFQVTVIVNYLTSAPNIYYRVLGVDTQMTLNTSMTYTFGFVTMYTYEAEYAGTAADLISWVISPSFIQYYSISITDIEVTAIGFLSAVIGNRHLLDISQVDFIKLMCNMFGLIPEVNSRTRKIKFWNYEELYNNIPIARDWSKYLSERDDEMEFKFGDYAQNNYFRYKESEDVIQDEGMGNMLIEDDTLQNAKDVVELPISTCEQVNILNNIFSVDVSRIGFNKWDDTTSLYESNKKIDARIVYVDHVKSIASPPYEKTFGIRPTVAPGGATDIDSPKKASSLEVSFSYLITNYSGLSRLLTKTNLRRAKFNLPVYEVAGLKHYIPIYLNQYKAYFYVNKINNYVPGQLCTIDLIKL
jgi:hypothetical protein